MAIFAPPRERKILVRRLREFIKKKKKNKELLAFIRNVTWKLKKMSVEMKKLSRGQTYALHGKTIEV